MAFNYSVQYVNLEEFVLGDFASDFLASFVEFADVSFGDAVLTLIDLDSVLKTVQEMIESSEDAVLDAVDYGSGCIKEESEYLEFLRETLIAIQDFAKANPDVLVNLED